MSYESRTGAVLFTSRMERIAAFYSGVLDLIEAARDADHVLLESPGFQLVVHRIPGGPAASIDDAAPPLRRATAALKPVFFVSSLAGVRIAVEAQGGIMDPLGAEWSFNGERVCDGLDPDGNVIQFREKG